MLFSVMIMGEKFKVVKEIFKKLFKDFFEKSRVIFNNFKTGLKSFTEQKNLK